MITLPHILDPIADAVQAATRVFRGWMEDVTERININDAAARGLIFVKTIDDFPPVYNGIITLVDNYTYWILDTIDLKGYRIVGGQNTTILGSSSENSRLKSTGLNSSTALISSEWTMPIRHITFEAAKIFDLDASGNPNQALDWYGVNLVSSNVGTIANYDNFVAGSMAFLGCAGLVFDGTFGTIAFTATLLQGTGSGTIVTLPSTLTVTRRFRLDYSSVVVFGSGVGISVSTSASIPVEGYILDTVNFSGGATYTTGVAYDDNKARWTECRGVKNSIAATGYYMHGNATATTISATSTPVKAAGITTGNTISQRFNRTDNRATYTGAIERDFNVTVVLSLSSGNGHQVGIYIAKNGAVINESETYVTTNASGRLENGACQTPIDLEDGDYLEVWVENNTSTTDITVSDLNVMISASN